MGFKSEAQRKAFFAKQKNLQSKLQSETQVLEKRRVEVLAQQQEHLKSAQMRQKISSLKQSVKDVKKAERDLKVQQFKESGTGKVLTRTGRGLKRGGSAVVQFEKKHGKAQAKTAKKFLKKLFT